MAISRQSIFGQVLRFAQPLIGSLFESAKTFQVPVRIKGAPSQTGNLLELYEHDNTTADGNALVVFSSAGAMAIGLWNSIRVADGNKFSTAQAAIDNLSTDSGLVIIPSDYSGAAPTTVPVNVSVLDLQRRTATGGVDSQHGLILTYGTTPDSMRELLAGIFSFPKESPLLIGWEIPDSGAGSSGVVERGAAAAHFLVRNNDPHYDSGAINALNFCPVTSDGGGCWGGTFVTVGGAAKDAKLVGIEIDVQPQLETPTVISTISRTSNVVTLVTTSVHGLSTNDVIFVRSVTADDFIGAYKVSTVPNTTTITYAQTAGDDTGVVTGSSKVVLINTGSQDKAGILLNITDSGGGAAITIGSGAPRQSVWTNGIDFLQDSLNPFSGALIAAGSSRFNTGIGFGNATFRTAWGILNNNDILRFNGTGSDHARIKNTSSDFLALIGGTGGISFRDQGDTKNWAVVTESTESFQFVSSALIHRGFQTLDDTGTPSIQGANIFKTGGTTAITAFDNGLNGQVITLISAHSVTVTDGANLNLAGAVNYDMTATDTLTLVYDGTSWFETARSVN